ICTALCVMSAACGRAAERKASEIPVVNNQLPVHNVPSYAIVPFDLTSLSLPPGYRGHDIETVCDLAEYPTGKSLDGLYAFRLESRLDGRETDAALTLATKLTYTPQHEINQMSLRTGIIPVWGETTKNPWTRLGSVRGVPIKS